MLEYLTIVIGVALFGIQHSGISALSVKGRIIDRWGKEGYSRLYSFTSIVTILIAFLTMWFWDWFYFIMRPSEIEPISFLSGVILGCIGVLIAIRASSVISVSTVADMRSDRLPELITDGLYSRIRHPLYLATIILLMALGLIYPFGEVITFSIALIGYTLVGAFLEERKLTLHYGEEYQEYKKHAGFILPRLRASA
ncbi:MAG: methyltransferase family protein [Candidatus Thorarchaeota archaeon]|jgi:protein-S-isoprenylcysteine O-methyltransferase Ste14